MWTPQFFIAIAVVVGVVLFLITAIWRLGSLGGNDAAANAAFLKLAGGKHNAFLFESVEGGAVRGRYSIIGLEPDLIWRTVSGHAEVNRTPRANPGG